MWTRSLANGRFTDKLERYRGGGGGAPGAAFTATVPGHQGLFFVRLDGDWDAQPLSPGAVGFYYVRNRILLPHLGRPAQRDMNETAVPVLALAMNADAVTGAMRSFSPLDHFGNGPNLFLYGLGRPNTGSDPLGLFTYAEQVGTASAWAALYQSATTGAAGVWGFAQAVAGAAAAQSFVTSATIIGAAATYGSTIDVGMYPVLFEELGRFMQWAGNHGDRVRQSFNAWRNNAANPNPGDPWNDWNRYNHTLKHATQWFGVNKDQLTPDQIAQWGRLIERVAGSDKTFQWSTGGEVTIAHLAKIDGKWLCVQFSQGTNALVTAFVPNQSQLQEMLRLMGGS